MSLSGIYTIRNFEKWPSWQCVYEWEEDFSSQLGVRLIYVNEVRYKFLSIYRKLYRVTNMLPIKGKQKISADNLMLAFLMDPYLVINFSGKNIVPIIIDFWAHQLDDFERLFKKFEIVFVTSLQIKEMLKERMKGAVRIEYIPLPISRRWKRQLNDNKSIDIIQIGRKNNLLHEYALRLTNEFPGIEYVYQENINGQLHYSSTKRGVIGNFHRREDYMRLLHDSKISLVSSPGIDSGKETGDINPITPRFTESMINYCYLIGRYSDNLDFTYWKIHDYCPNVNSYEEFKYHALKYLNLPFSKVDEYDKFLENFYADRIAQDVLGFLQRG